MWPSIMLLVLFMFLFTLIFLVFIKNVLVIVINLLILYLITLKLLAEFKKKEMAKLRNWRNNLSNAYNNIRQSVPTMANNNTNTASIHHTTNNKKNPIAINCRIFFLSIKVSFGYYSKPRSKYSL